MIIKQSNLKDYILAEISSKKGNAYQEIISLKNSGDTP